MSYYSIPNQPIRFMPAAQAQSDACGCGGDYKQFVDFDDQLFFQLRSDACESSVYGGTETVQSWTIEGSDIVSAAASPTAFYSRPYFPLQPYTSFAVEVVVTEITGTLTIGFTDSGTQEIGVAGTYTLYFNSDHLLTNGSISLVVSGATFVGTFRIANVYAFPSAAPYVALVDAATLEPVVDITPVVTVSDNYITAGINVPDIEAGCGSYRLAIADWCTNTCGQYYIYNGMFAPSRSGVAGWTSAAISGTAAWTLTDNSASIEMGSGDVSSLTSLTQLCAGVEYTITVQVEAIQNARIRASVNGVLMAGSITATGTQTLTFTPAASGLFALVASQIDGVPSSVEVSRVTIQASEGYRAFDLYSDELAIGDYDTCEYFKIEGCNASDAFGFKFEGSSFLPGIRLHGRAWAAQYDTTVDSFRNSAGEWNAAFVDRRKKKQYSFPQLPEYVLDYLSIAFYFDNAYVNASLVYPAEDEFPQITYDAANDLGNLQIELYGKVDKVTKTRCVEADANCLPSILDLQDEPFLLTQSGERLTTQGGVNLYYQN